MTRQPPEPDPDQPEVPAAPADVPAGTAPPVRSQGETSETMPPVEGIRTPGPDGPALDSPGGEGLEADGPEADGPEADGPGGPEDPE